MKTQKKHILDGRKPYKNESVGGQGGLPAVSEGAQGPRLHGVDYHYIPARIVLSEYHYVPAGIVFFFRISLCTCRKVWSDSKTVVL